MIQFPRKTLYQFGSTQPANSTAVVGSQAAGAVAYTTDLVTMQTGGGAGPTTQYANGMVGAAGPLIGNGSPTAPDFNALWQLALNQAAYLLQQGVAAWDTGTTYYPGNFCAYPPNDAVNANIYLGQSANNTGNNPSTDSGTNWLPWLNQVKAPTLCKAFANFSGFGITPGSNCTIFSAFGISHILKNGVGDYTVFFLSGTFTTATYVTTGNSSAGQSATPGQNPQILAEWWQSSGQDKTSGHVRITTGGSPGDIAEECFNGGVAFFGF